VKPRGNLGREGISLTLTLSQRERENNNEIAEQEFVLS